MPSSRRTRERHLAKLAERRRRERLRARRRKMVATGLVVLLVLGGMGTALYLLAKGGKKPAAAASASASASPTPTASASPAVACGGTVPKAASAQKPSYKKAPTFTIDKSKTYRATMVTSCGTVVIDLDPKSAPQTVNSLVFLIKHHFYDGLTFHRISQGFVIQGGDPKGDGTGGPGYSTVDEPPADATYPKGTVAMAKGGSDPAGTAGSQFFIVTGQDAQSALAPTGQGPLYALVGHVVKGLDVVDKIAAIPIQGGSTDGPPGQTVYIVKITVKAT